MDFYKCTQTLIKLSNGKKFYIIHDLPLKGNIGSLDAALDNWLARTHKYTAQSFVDYINSKGEHRAYTRRQLHQLLKKFEK